MIKAFYKDIKDSDTEKVPSFNSVWNSIEKKKLAGERYKLLRYAALLVFAAGMSWLLVSNETANTAEETAEISEIEWVYPTDQLLTYSEEVFDYDFTLYDDSNVNTEKNEVQNEDENNNL